MKIGENDKHNVLQAAADLGRANGIAAAAKVVAELANHKGRVVGTNEIRDLVAALNDKADALRREAKETLSLYQIILNN